MASTVAEVRNQLNTAITTDGDTSNIKFEFAETNGKVQDSDVHQSFQDANQWLEDLKTRLESLKMVKVQYETELKSAQAECIELYGTADINELRELYTTQHKANQEAMTTFVSDLADLEAIIKTAELQINK